jgi:hypothetical protein
MTYTFNPDIVYCVELHDVKLFNKKTNQSLTLNYPEAAIFDLLVKEYPHLTMIRMLSKIGFMTESHAESLLNDTLDFLMQHNVFIIHEAPSSP